jgi:hypothetical protein
MTDPTIGVGEAAARAPREPLEPLEPEQVQLLAWAVTNCHTLARRALARTVSVYDREKWEHVLRICEKAGARSAGVLRASVPTELTEGEGLAAARSALPPLQTAEDKEDARVESSCPSVAPIGSTASEQRGSSPAAERTDPEQDEPHPFLSSLPEEIRMSTPVEPCCEGTMAGSHDPTCPMFHAKTKIRAHDLIERCVEHPDATHELHCAQCIAESDGEESAALPRVPEPDLLKALDERINLLPREGPPSRPMVQLGYVLEIVRAARAGAEAPPPEEP